jgi:hypothetical protein
MNDNLLAGYSYLWDGSQPGWVLLRDSDGGYCVYHKTNEVICLIESDDLNEVVCKKMLEEGCEILDDLPPTMRNATVLPI